MIAVRAPVHAYDRTQRDSPPHHYRHASSGTPHQFYKLVLTRRGDIHRLQHRVELFNGYFMDILNPLNPSDSYNPWWQLSRPLDSRSGGQWNSLRVSMEFESKGVRDFIQQHLNCRCALVLSLERADPEAARYITPREVGQSRLGASWKDIRPASRIPDNWRLEGVDCRLYIVCTFRRQDSPDVLRLYNQPGRR
jgi:hypothetical protein